MLYINKLKYFAAVLATGLVFDACKKTETLAPARQFMPAGVITVTTAPTSAKLEWKEALYADSARTSYVIELSKDTLFAAGPEKRYTSDSTSITVYDTDLAVRTNYFARVKTKGADTTLDSKWLRSNAFKITGEQIFQSIREAELKDKEVTLRWNITSDVTRIVLTPASGTPVTTTLVAADISAGLRKITGLTAATTYTAEIFTATKSKGLLTFTTQAPITLSFTITPADNLVTVLDTCSNNAVIGLQPGTYTSGNTVNFIIKEKTVTLRSVSGNPADTKVNFKEFTLRGTGAGIKMYGIDFDASVSAGSYFLNLVGTASDAAAATFTGITVENCTVRNYGNCLLRGNRGTNAGDHKIGVVRFRNVVASNNTLAAFYSEFTFDKLQFEKLDLSNSTFYNQGQTIVSCATTMAVTPIPVIAMDGITVNNFGANGKYPLFDASANPVAVSITNSHFANTPRSGSVLANPFRATAATSTIVFSYNNVYNLNSGTAALVMPTYTYLTQTQNRSENVGYTATTTDFTLPAGNVLRTGGSTGGPIGDPRWAY